LPLLVLYGIVVLFFFQAEDGIRDFHVTGVQTCALPIFAGLRTTQMSINGDGVVVTHKDSGGWRELLSGAGTRSVSVGAAGIFLEIGRASCRERVWIWVGAVSSTEK